MSYEEEEGGGLSLSSYLVVAFVAWWGKNERQIIRMLGKIIVILTSFPSYFVSFFLASQHTYHLNMLRMTWHAIPKQKKTRGGRHDHFSSRQWRYCSIYMHRLYIYIYIFSYIVSVNSERNTWLTSFLFLIKCRVFIRGNFPLVWICF